MLQYSYICYSVVFKYHSTAQHCKTIILIYDSALSAENGSFCIFFNFNFVYCTVRYRMTTPDRAINFNLNFYLIFYNVNILI